MHALSYALGFAAAGPINLAAPLGLPLLDPFDRDAAVRVGVGIGFDGRQAVTAVVRARTMVVNFILAVDLLFQRFMNAFGLSVRIEWLMMMRRG